MHLHTFLRAAARIRAVFPSGIPIDQRVNNQGNPIQQALQRTQLRDDFTNNQVASLACIYLTKTEHYQLDRFIGQYIQTRNLLSIPDIRQVLSSILESYPGKPPVMVNELNAWLDRKLGHRATHPEFPQLPE